MKEQLLSTLENSKTYTLAVADAMPEKMYGTKPCKDVWDFRELLNHIAYGIQWWEANYVKGNKIEWAPPQAKSNKKETADYLIDAYLSLQNTLKSSTLDDEKIRGFFATLDHITHHRGQAVTYLKYAIPKFQKVFSTKKLLSFHF